MDGIPSDPFLDPLQPCSDDTDVQDTKIEEVEIDIKGEDVSWYHVFRNVLKDSLSSPSESDSDEVGDGSENGGGI